MGNHVLKRAFISGASGAIGKAIALSLAADGYDLLLHGNTHIERVHALARHIRTTYNQSVHCCQANLTLETELDRLLQHIGSFQPNVLIHNAGNAPYGLFTDMTQSEYADTVHIHLTSPFRINQRAVSPMLQHGWGRIIYISSIWGETGAACESVYSMVKGANISFVKALAKELAPSNITVNAVSPGAIDTTMLAHIDEEEREQLRRDIPMERFGTPDEVASAVRYLADKKSNYVTGHVLRVNGGWYT